MEYPNLNELAKKAHQNAKEKGFYNETRNTGEFFMLMVSELGEALDAHRKGKFSGVIDYSLMGEFDLLEWDANVKGTFDEELADTAIRIMDFCAYKSININLEYYANVGEFQVAPHANVGNELIDVTNLLCKACIAQRSIDFLESDLEFTVLSQSLNAALICLFELADSLSIDLLWHIQSKMKYNETRPYKHAKAY